MEKRPFVVQWSSTFWTDSLFPWVFNKTIRYQKTKPSGYSLIQYSLKLTTSTGHKGGKKWNLIIITRNWLGECSCPYRNSWAQHKLVIKDEYVIPQAIWKLQHILPVQRARKFSAVLGATSEKSCKTIAKEILKVKLKRKCKDSLIAEAGDKQQEPHHSLRWKKIYPLVILITNSTSKTIRSTGSPSTDTSIKTKGFFFFVILCLPEMKLKLI